MNPRKQAGHIQGAVLDQGGDIRSGDRSPVGGTSIRNEAEKALLFLRFIPRNSRYPFIDLSLDADGYEGCMPFVSMVGSL